MDNLLEVLLTLIFGAFIGWVASIIMKRDEQQGWIANVIVGVVGALVGNVIAHNLFDVNASSFSLWGLVFGIIGAVVLCAILNLLQRKQLR